MIQIENYDYISIIIYADSYVVMLINCIIVMENAVKTHTHRHTESISKFCFGVFFLFCFGNLHNSIVEYPTRIK